MWTNFEDQTQPLHLNDKEEQDTKFLMLGDVLTLERKGRPFTKTELSLLEKVEKERASLLPPTISVNPRDLREKELSKRSEKKNFLFVFLKFVKEV